MVKKDSGLPEQDGWFRDITASRGFEKVQADEIWAIARKMAEPCSKKDLKEQEVTSGIVFNTHSLLWSDQKEKMVPERILYDTMHSYYSNGCASWEIALLLQAIYTRTNVTREVLQEAVLACHVEKLEIVVVKLKLTSVLFLMKRSAMKNSSRARRTRQLPLSL